jgi:hypothetical protein
MKNLRDPALVALLPFVVKSFQLIKKSNPVGLRAFVKTIKMHAHELPAYEIYAR